MDEIEYSKRIGWADSDWADVGPLNGVTQDPNNPEIYYKTTKKNNATTLDVSKSRDYGHSFKKLSTITLRNSYDGGRIFVDPTDSEIIYVTICGGSGVYYYSLSTANFREIKKMILLR